MSRTLRPEFTGKEAVSWDSGIHRVPCVAYTKFSTNGDYYCYLMLCSLQAFNIYIYIFGLTHCTWQSRRTKKAAFIILTSLCLEGPPASTELELHPSGDGARGTPARSTLSLISPLTHTAGHNPSYLGTEGGKPSFPSTSRGAKSHNQRLFFCRAGSRGRERGHLAKGPEILVAGSFVNRSVSPQHGIHTRPRLIGLLMTPSVYVGPAARRPCARQFPDVFKFKSLRKSRWDGMGV